MTGVYEAGMRNAYQSYAAKTAGRQTEQTDGLTGAAQTDTADYGRTIGEPKLSETAQAYYEQLKKRYGAYDFILVSEDQKANAQANAAQYANPLKTVVLIDEDKIERMATDESYRRQYEAILSGAATQLQQLKSGMESSGVSVKGYGMQVNDGGLTSFFAVLKKSSADQKARIEASAEKKRTEKKAAERKAEKQEEQERLEQARTKRTEQTNVEADAAEAEEETVTISAGSIEELMQKLEDYAYEERSGYVRTESERYVGSAFDWKG